MNALLQQRERGTAREREIVVVAYRNAEKMLVRVKAKTSALNKPSKQFAAAKATAAAPQLLMTNKQEEKEA
jgi:hypothetical protein